MYQYIEEFYHAAKTKQKHRADNLPGTKLYQHTAAEARIHKVRTWHESIYLSPPYKNISL